MNNSIVAIHEKYTVNDTRNEFDEHFSEETEASAAERNIDENHSSIYDGPIDINANLKRIKAEENFEINKIKLIHQRNEEEILASEFEIKLHGAQNKLYALKDRKDAFEYEFKKLKDVEKPKVPFILSLPSIVALSIFAIVADGISNYDIISKALLEIPSLLIVFSVAFTALIDIAPIPLSSMIYKTFDAKEVKEKIVYLSITFVLISILIGDAAGEQEELGPKELSRLKSIWSAVLDATNCDYCFDSSLPNNENYEASGYVSSVPIMNEEVASPHIISTYFIDESKVLFKADQAEYENEEEAEKALIEIANELIKHSDNKVYLAGMTATGNKKYCNSLSFDRANAVKRSLIKLGVDENQLLVVGLGCEDNMWRVNDCDKNGTLIEELAKTNRKVLVIDVNSEDAKFLNIVN